MTAPAGPTMSAPTRAATVAALLAAATVLTAAASDTSTLTTPSWLKASEQQTLDRVFGGARPMHTVTISYPHKIAVVFEFNHVVICGACSAPSNASLPRGRVIRVSYDRSTHQLGGAGNGIAMRFCEARGLRPPRAQCLRP
jgi:hypothetical protein